MKKTRRIAWLMAMLMLMSQMVGIAASGSTGTTEYDPQTMTFEERAQWVDEHVEPKCNNILYPGFIFT